MATRALGGGRAPGAAILSVGNADDAACVAQDRQPAQASTHLTFDQLQRRAGERHADLMARWRVAGIFVERPAVLDGELPRPFAIGIDQVLLLRLDRQRCEPATLNRLIGQLCKTRLYLEGLARAGSRRHDIDGHPAEPVSAEHRAGARRWLDDRVAARKAREEKSRANARRPTLRLSGVAA